MRATDKRQRPRLQLLPGGGQGRATNVELRAFCQRIGWQQPTPTTLDSGYEEQLLRRIFADQAPDGNDAEPLDWEVGDCQRDGSSQHETVAAPDHQPAGNLVVLALERRRRRGASVAAVTGLSRVAVAARPERRAGRFAGAAAGVTARVVPEVSSEKVSREKAAHSEAAGVGYRWLAVVAVALLLLVTMARRSSAPLSLQRDDAVFTAVPEVTQRPLRAPPKTIPPARLPKMPAEPRSTESPDPGGRLAHLERARNDVQPPRQRTSPRRSRRPSMQQPRRALSRSSSQPRRPRLASSRRSLARVDPVRPVRPVVGEPNLSPLRFGNTASLETADFGDHRRAGPAAAPAFDESLSPAKSAGMFGASVAWQPPRSPALAARPASLPQRGNALAAKVDRLLGASWLQLNMAPTKAADLPPGVGVMARLRGQF